MRIYKNKIKMSFVGLDLENKKVSTRSGYPEIFFSKIINKEYSFFDYFISKVKEANETYIDFIEVNEDIERYVYIGDATNKEELINLLNEDKKAVILINYSKEGFLCCTRRNSHKFCFPGGKVDDNEKPYDALLREVFEETGINLKNKEVTLYKICQEYGFETYVYISFLEDLKPILKESGIVPFFTSKNYLLSDNAEFKEFNIEFFDELKFLYL